MSGEQWRKTDKSLINFRSSFMESPTSKLSLSPGIYMQVFNRKLLFIPPPLRKNFLTFFCVGTVEVAVAAFFNPHQLKAHEPCEVNEVNRVSSHVFTARFPCP